MRGLAWGFVKGFVITYVAIVVLATVVVIGAAT